MDKLERIKELVKILNDASRAYYMEDQEIMSNLTYDALYDELLKLEEETGTVLANSPTQKVGYEVVSSLPKEAHPQPMLSLDKTKDPEALREWLNGREGVLSWKMDGLTVVLTYENGELIKAVTRGNGEIGEVITNNAKTFVNIPGRIPYKGKLSLRGEAIITYSDFERINESIVDIDAKYKNPRNLCSGSVRQLNNRITAERNVRFYAFSMVEPDDEELVKSFENSFVKRFEYLKSLGFEVVEYKTVTPDTIIDAIKWFSGEISHNDFPSDGLVLSYEDVEYGRSLGRTAKFPRNAIAFKWKDEQAETVLREIEWSPSRTGLINPVAVFDPVELEGTTVSRASVHNISIVKELALGTGDRITVYKANMIIPQIAENLTRSAVLEIPEACPSCGGRTCIKNENGTETLFCENPECPAKNIKGFALFASRNAMNIDGLSEATIEKFVDKGFIKNYTDFYKLDRYRDEIVNMEGFGEKSYTNLQNSLEASKKVPVAAFIYALGITGVGTANAKLIAKHFDEDTEKIKNATAEELSEVEGIGEVIAGDFVKYFENPKMREQYDELLSFLALSKSEKSGVQDLEGKTFVITGSLNTYANRDELKLEIESRGGKVSGSVSKNTSYLINNDIASNSGKNKKAKELGVPIISEEDYRMNNF
ncbi:MAG: NAD-dependent DNA ligase LigA [Eubacterium sp.]|nr:NAD-dependent DNA ligase LigA [Eubacterium sp.]